MDEKLQIRKVLKGDTSAFGYFVDTYQDMAITIAYRVCGNKQDAEDIVQNAFVKAFHNLETFRSDSKFSTWFYRIVYNTAITETRGVGRNTEFEDYKMADTAYYSDMDTMTQIEENERNEMINKTLDMMPKDESVLLTLYYLEDNPVKDIAVITNLTEANVKVKLHRARKRFAEIASQQMRI
ncbi:RNA polymerase sigma-70 factor (ECF subfamily) [Dysgonomonas hofstadii]|uniref:RNA polymerase sigma factor n=1 Tax=Dysgonomonas hofstadii TaxID=637886 RepID=A0A840D015_9BACT|nr:sigma-70 family RNA polymerase sigma factor [Dysgonomonas hofstadii]MBB4037603.1 RNA polymerase sigma-70 factor (ECF subfamily) [Dysgonomonas hofstadii]